MKQPAFSQFKSIGNGFPQILFSVAITAISVYCDAHAQSMDYPGMYYVTTAKAKSLTSAFTTNQLPLGEGLSLRTTVGMAEYRLRASGVVIQNQGMNKAVLGLGIEARITRNLSVSSDLRLTQYESDPLSHLVFGAKYSF